MNAIARLVLKILKFDARKIDVWLKNKNVHTIETYKKVNRRWEERGHQVKKKLGYLELNEKNPKEYLKKLNKIERRSKIIKKSWDKGQILFDSFSEFKKFSWWLALFHMGYLKLTMKNIKHEKEHAQVYEKQRMKCQFGWRKLLDKEHKKYIYQPFVTAIAPKKIHLRAIKAASKLSEGDKSAIRRYKI